MAGVIKGEGRKEEGERRKGGGERGRRKGKRKGEGEILGEKETKGKGS